MRTDKVITALLDYLAQNAVLNVSIFSSIQKKKLHSILSTANLDIAALTSHYTPSMNEQCKIVLSILQHGGEPTNVFKVLEWKHFELLTALIFDESGYTVSTNFRFKDNITRYEIDVIAFKFPYLFSIDCKFHQKKNSSYLRNAAKKQKERTEAMMDAFQEISDELIKKLSLLTKQKLYVTPAILSWREGTIQIFQGIPIVPFQQLRGFTQEIDEYRSDIFSFPIEIL